MTLDSSYAYTHQVPRFVDLVDEAWTRDQLPSETLFPNVSEFDEDDDLDILVSLLSKSKSIWTWSIIKCFI